MLTAERQVTRSDRRRASDAKAAAQEVLRRCLGLLAAHEVEHATPEDVPDGRPLVSVRLHRLSAEAHAMHGCCIYADLAAALEHCARRLRGSERSEVLRIAGLIRGG